MLGLLCWQSQTVAIQGWDALGVIGMDEGKIAFTSHDTLLKKEVLSFQIRGSLKHKKGFQIAEDAENYSK